MMNRDYLAPIGALTVSVAIVNGVLILMGVPPAVIIIPSVLLVVLYIVGNALWWAFGRGRISDTP